MATKVNLDALIPREDFEVIKSGTQGQRIMNLQIRDLESTSFFYIQLRKPDFQRETNEWDPTRIVDLIKSFVEDELIPSIILWKGGGNTFVIDGSHRLSALIAWVMDDYGDGETSRRFFDGNIPDEQKKIAQKTRDLVKKQIGAFGDFQLAAKMPDKVETKILNYAKNLGSCALQLQWVIGDAAKAEESFFKINQKAAPLNETEIKLLKNRKKPNAIASRSIIHCGTGHKYWSRFSDEKQYLIEKIAKEIHELLFSPEFNTPIKTLDLPIAGKSYSSNTLPLIYEFVNLANKVSENEISEDLTGEITVDFLKKCHKIVNRITGTYPSSLGLHPAVYFYRNTGNYDQSSFLSWISLIEELEANNELNKFIDKRDKFETFLLKYKDLTAQFMHKHAGGIKGVTPLLEFYRFLIECHFQNLSEDSILDKIKEDKRFEFLKPNLSSEIDTSSSSFSKETKSAAFLREALTNPMKCGICGGLIHVSSTTIDHIERREDGGKGSLDNAQLAHPYCNSTYKH